MAEPFLGQIQMFGFDFPPRGWAHCSGQLLAIAQNQALFSILGTTYGGDGVTTFALPNLQGRVPMHWGQGPGLSSRNLGEVGGQAATTLISNQIPGHTHLASASNTAPAVASPANNFWAQGNYSGTVNGPMAAGAIGNSGGGQPHPNMAPYLGIYFSIALAGIFPSRN
jgi:microcystin-dependent protein